MPKISKEPLFRYSLNLPREVAIVLEREAKDHGHTVVSWVRWLLTRYKDGETIRRKGDKNECMER